MSEIVKAESNNHWYLNDGTPFYEVPYPKTSKAKAIVEWRKTGEGPEPMKKVSLREARPQNALPSVTNIISVMDKPQLVRWKVEQGIIAAVTMPDSTREKFGDDLEGLAQAIASDAKDITSSAAAFGTKVHDAIEEWIINGSEPEDSTIRAHFDLFAEWYVENVEEIYYTERVVIGDGYAGRVDIKAKIRGIGNAIADFKTRKSQKGKFVSYETDAMQLTAYREADAGMPDTGPVADRCVSIYIDSGDPRSPVVKEWDESDCERWMEAFFACQNLWCLTKNYDPRTA